MQLCTGDCQRLSPDGTTKTFKICRRRGDQQFSNSESNIILRQKLQRLLQAQVTFGCDITGRRQKLDNCCWNDLGSNVQVCEGGDYRKQMFAQIWVTPPSPPPLTLPPSTSPTRGPTTGSTTGPTTGPTGTPTTGSPTTGSPTLSQEALAAGYLLEPIKYCRDCTRHVSNYAYTPVYDNSCPAYSSLVQETTTHQANWCDRFSSYGNNHRIGNIYPAAPSPLPAGAVLSLTPASIGVVLLFGDAAGLTGHIIGNVTTAATTPVSGRISASNAAKMWQLKVRQRQDLRQLRHDLRRQFIRHISGDSSSNSSSDRNSNFVTDWTSHHFTVPFREPNFASDCSANSFSNSLANFSTDDGNVYLTGVFYTRATFGTGYTATVLSSSGGADVYVAKLSSAGTMLWAIKAGGASTDIGYGIASSVGTSDIFVGGWFQSTTATFGSTVLTGGASGDWDAFLMKVSSLGTVSWVLRSIGPGNEELISVEADPSGNGGAIMTGDFSGTMTFGSGYSAHVLVSKGYMDMYTLKVAATGTVVWAMQGGGSSGDDIGSGVAIETSSGSVFVTGWMESALGTFGATAVANRGSSGSSDVFVLKASSQGTILWTHTFGGTADDNGRRIQVDAYGDVVFGGCFQSTYATFGGASITAHTGTGGDVFVTKVSGSGTVGWTAHAGGSSDDCAYGIVMNATTRNVYVTGFTQSSPATFGDKVLVPYGYQDVFVMKLSALGTTMWAMRAGGSHSSQADQGRDVALDSNGNVYVMGYTSLPTQFGSVSVSGSSNYYHAFAMQIHGKAYAPPPPSPPPPPEPPVPTSTQPTSAFSTTFPPPSPSSSPCSAALATVPFPPPPPVISVTSRISNELDDFEEGPTWTEPYSCTNGNAGNSASGWLYSCSTDLEFVVDAGSPSVSDLVGMRFTNIQVPQGAYVLTADIEFTVDETSYSPGTITFRAEAADNAAQSRYNSAKLSYRTKTSASATWALPAGPPYIGAKESTSNIAAVIQEVVLRPGWYPGNAILIIASDQTARRVYESYDGSVRQHSDTSRAPLLTISYSTFPMTISPTLNPTQAPTMSPTGSPTTTPVCFW
ncbi:hypothetical protein CYMTET_8107, partial [Cymbomonas tetramitiformis]